jgi:hypothetical protein
MTDDKKLAKISQFAKILETIRRVSVLGADGPTIEYALQCGCDALDDAQLADELRQQSKTQFPVPRSNNDPLV